MTSGSTGARAGWTLADQLVASSTNALLSIVVARSVGALEFGAFALAFLVFAFVLGIVRALVTDPLLIAHAADEPEAQRTACARAAGASVVLGVAAGLACVLVGAVLGGATGDVLVALAAVLPGLLVQDAWRRAFFGLGRPQAAFVNDLVWSVLQFSCVLLLMTSGEPGVPLLLLGWGLSGGVAAALGCAQVGRWPRPVEGMRWLWGQRALGVRLGMDFLVSQGTFTLAMAVISATAGLAVVGAVRAAQVLLAPVQVLLLAVSSFVLPMLATAREELARVRRLVRLVMAGAAGCTAAYCLPLLVVPDSVGRRLLGASWSGADSVLPLLSAQMLLIAVATGPSLGLKALSLPSALLRVSLVQAPVLLVASVVGAELADAPGAAGGFVVAHVLGTWVIVRAVRSATRPSRVPDPETGPPPPPADREGGGGPDQEARAVTVAPGAS